MKMETVGAFEAKTHLSNLLDRVSKGETITITRHGVPTALLIPFDTAAKKLTHTSIVQGMRSLRKQIKPSKMTIRQMIEEGRRY